MLNPETSYFLPPAWHFQVGGPISLGNIITDHKSPQDAVNDSSKQTMPALFIDHLKPNAQIIISDSKASSAGIGSSLLELFGFSADLTIERVTPRKWIIDAKELRTQEINPKNEYAEKCLADPDVRIALASKRFWNKNLYMIVGIMSVASAQVTDDSEGVTKRLFNIKIGADLAPVTGGVPLNAYVQVARSTERGAQGSFGPSDFVLAYKLKQISCFRSKIKLKDVKKGTVLDEYDNVGAYTSDAEDEKSIGIEIEDVRFEEHTADSQDFELASTTGIMSIEGQEVEIEFVLPMYPDSDL